MESGQEKQRGVAYAAAGRDHNDRGRERRRRSKPIDRGKGRPILFLHPGIGIEPDAPVLAALANGGRVIAPSHPGFGTSQLPKGMTTVDDLSYFYLDLLDQLDLRDVLWSASSLGGWIAAEIAVKTTSAALASRPGQCGRHQGRRPRDPRHRRHLVADAETNSTSSPISIPRSASATTRPCRKPRSLAAARNREATARFAWSPYMHNPKLKSRLHRIRMPTLFLWGTADRMLRESYGRAYCGAIPGARFEPIERAGHFPHLEQPEEFARRVLAFAEAATQRRAKRA